jgi:hypothetical protein
MRNSNNNVTGLQDGLIIGEDPILDVGANENYILLIMNAKHA